MKLEMTILNYTGHEVVYLDNNDKKIVFPPQGSARMPSQNYRTINMGGINIFIYNDHQDTDIEGLPPEKDGLMYIVSSVVHLNMSRFRNDLLAPCRFERDEQGNNKACRAFKIC